MFLHKYKHWWAVCCISLAFLYGAWYIQARLAVASGCILVSMLDVGQGDSFLVSTPWGNQLLIDAGKGGNAAKELLTAMPAFDKNIEVAILTHPDQDHIGGFIDVSKLFHIDTALVTDVYTTSSTFTSVIRALQDSGTTFVKGFRGEDIDLGRGVVAHIIYPDGPVYDKPTNDGSIVALLTYKDQRILFTGDIPSGVETYLSKTYPQDIFANVFKLAHHGSKNSSSDIFLDTVKPQWALISAGINNSYGHPHQEVLEKLADRNIPYKNTQTEGRVSWCLE